MAASRPTVGPRQVLVVEDDEETRAGLAMLLETWGHQIVDVPTAAAALDVLSWLRPDFAIIDIDLPGMDGCELARKLRARPHCPLLIAYTGHPEERRRAMKAGFAAFLVKPEGLEDLHEILGEPRFRRHASGR